MTDIILANQASGLITSDDIERMKQAGQVANNMARAGVFDEYLSKRSANTRRRQLSDLETFASFLVAARIWSPDTDTAARAALLQTCGDIWHGVTFGIVTAYRDWLLQNAYAVGTVNIKLSTVRTYASLAFDAGAISHDEHLRIQNVSGYSRKETKQIDAQRKKTRTGEKKAKHTPITDRQAEKLKAGHDDTPAGKRDALLMALLLDHGLRVGEIAALSTTNFRLDAGELVFYRPKVDKVQTLKLSADTLKAARAYFAVLPVVAGSIWFASTKGGELGIVRGDDTVLSIMSERSLTRRVGVIGQRTGIDKLSAHDCRHFWATYWAKRVEKLPRGVFTLQEAGGWSSLAMPRRYVEEARIANEGMA